MQKTKQIGDILTEEELAMFRPAIIDMRNQVCGDVILSFRQGYIYHIKLLVNSHVKKRGILIEDILTKDELVIFSPALVDMRKRGFGDIILPFNNGYITGARLVLDYHKNGNNGGKKP